MNTRLNLSQGYTENCHVPDIVTAGQLLAGKSGRVLSELRQGGHDISWVSLVEAADADNVIGDLRGRVRSLFSCKATRAINIAAAKPGSSVYDELAPLREAKALPFQVSALAAQFGLKRNSRIAGASALFPDGRNLTGEVFLSPEKIKGHDYTFGGDRSGDVEPGILRRSADLGILLQGGVFTDQPDTARSRLVVEMRGEVTPASITHLSKLLGINGPTVFRMSAVADQVATQAIETFPGSRIEATDTADLLGRLKQGHIFANKPLTQQARVEAVGLRDNTPYTQNGHFHGSVALPASGEVISGGHLNSVSGTAYITIDPVHAVYRLAYSL